MSACTNTIDSRAGLSLALCHYPLALLLSLTAGTIVLRVRMKAERPRSSSARSVTRKLTGGPSLEHDRLQPWPPAR